jgi:single stranded DNA-binding protein
MYEKILYKEKNMSFVNSYSLTEIIGHSGKDVKKDEIPISKLPEDANLSTVAEIEEKTQNAIVANFELATKERYKKGEKWETLTQWNSIKAWGKWAKKAEKIKKGDLVLIRGKNRIDKYQDKNGLEKIKPYILVNELVILQRKNRTLEGDFDIGI